MSASDDFVDRIFGVDRPTKIQRRKSNIKRSEKSDEAWKHNGLLGSNSMMMNHLRNVINSLTTTDNSKALARDMLNDAFNLGQMLKQRKK